MATVVLGGDVMLGRGVDQVLPHPDDPVLHERCVDDARTYVELAERANGAFPYPVDFGWPWGDVLPVLATIEPDLRLINLETSITANGAFACGKGVHYRMNPGNVAALSVISPVVCALANNHVLDFGVAGLTDTLETLDAAGIRHCGAGVDSAAAQAPVTMELDDRRRVVIVSIAVGSSGVPPSWAARRDRPGVWRVGDSPTTRAAEEVAARVAAHKRPDDVAIVSIHWGPNWGYGVGLSETQFVHRLLDAGVDLVHGHSAHHPRPIEIYHGKPALYGCGDVIDDYEGIRGHERYRTDLRLLYLASLDPEPAPIRLIPLRVRHMRLECADPGESHWLCAMIENISRDFGTRVTTRPGDLPMVFAPLRP
ncbi:CapA family protein [Nocardia sp. CNY236]|uniref:CapA family protein n=1 Tax=Nocardia sp. CNY236 TaxID=1169152 RepID=UPI0004102131|nr:CapA family protein [Nocardia sp. CNY236]